MKPIKICAVVFAAVMLNSCIGASADISIRADGSGRIALEYRLSPMLESLGRQDGNALRPIIPVGREDFERGAARINGLRLRSFSSKQVRSRTPEACDADGGKDTVVRAVLDFDDSAALLSFLDITGSHVSLVHENDSGSTNVLRMVLLESSAQTPNADLVSLLREACADYELRISLSAPKSASLAVFPSVQAARLVSRGKKVSFAIGIGELFGLTEGLALEISW